MTMSETKSKIENHPMMKKDWYYSIEIQPGIFTPGREHRNVILTRELLKGIQVKGRNCLDIGAMEGMISILLWRRGAAKVTSYDRIDFSEWISFIQERLGVPFNYIKGISLNKIKEFTSPFGLYPYDVVIFSGVLYHMFDPLSGLSAVRGLTRNGGIMLMETSAVLTEKDECLMYFNNAGRFFPGTNYWQISFSCLDYLLRLLHFELLDVSYYKSFNVDGIQQGRIAIVCRAVDGPVVSTGDEWMPKTISESFLPDFEEFIDWEELRINKSGDVPYESEKQAGVFHDGTSSLNVFESVKSIPETKFTDPDAQVRLKLDAMF
ncbi:MAG: DUF1698 domain-containing protein [Desulfobacteraceae bacterium]|nr:DUF1698 domain-containing protein [Desulfobacteraceae bacterium]MBC2755580.1 DUF1698 domain-containing protein [Desulfobacteraceae bacterium]